MYTYKLARPVLGQTHVGFDSVEMHPDEIILIGIFGRMVDGVFVPEHRINRVHRRIAWKEYRAFLQRPIDQGLPADKAGNFRTDDLTFWLDTYGYSNETRTWKEPTSVVEVNVEVLSG
jgi:hypothetical protein